jgi:hypothetical protein
MLPAFVSPDRTLKVADLLAECLHLERARNKHHLEGRKGGEPTGVSATERETHGFREALYVEEALNKAKMTSGSRDQLTAKVIQTPKGFSK